MQCKNNLQAHDILFVAWQPFNLQTDERYATKVDKDTGFTRMYTQMIVINAFCFMNNMDDKRTLSVFYFSKQKTTYIYKMS